MFFAQEEITIRFLEKMMKLKKRCLALPIGILFCCLTPLSFAANHDITRYDPINKTCRKLGHDSFWYGKGRHLFDQKCKTCHTRKNRVEAPFLYSESKTPKGWTRVFATRFPKCAKTGKWDITSDEGVLINDYLYRYGANTHRPNVAS